MIRVLFLCTGNSCRSQMAEGWAKSLKRAEIEACSAGTAPQRLDPRAVKVMAEAGVDIASQRSKGVGDLLDSTGQPLVFDYVVTVCDHARESCPVFSGSTPVVHLGFEDPPALAQTAATEEEALAHYRRVRDEIRACVEQMPVVLSQLILTKSTER